MSATDDERKPAFRWLQSQDAAKYIGRSYSALRQLVWQKRIPSRKVGGLRMFRTDELDAWIESGGKMPELEVPVEA